MQLPDTGSHSREPQSQAAEDNSWITTTPTILRGKTAVMGYREQHPDYKTWGGMKIEMTIIGTCFKSLLI